MAIPYVMVLVRGRFAPLAYGPLGLIQQPTSADRIGMPNMGKVPGRFLDISYYKLDGLNGFNPIKAEGATGGRV